MLLFVEQGSGGAGFAVAESVGSLKCDERLVKRTALGLVPKIVYRDVPSAWPDDSLQPVLGREKERGKERKLHYIIKEEGRCIQHQSLFLSISLSLSLFGPSHDDYNEYQVYPGHHFSNDSTLKHLASPPLARTFCAGRHLKTRPVSIHHIHSVTFAFQSASRLSFPSRQDTLLHPVSTTPSC